MTSPVICADTEQDVKECMALMTSKKIRHLPVLENNRLTGMVSLGDLVQSIIAEQNSQIKDFESYFRYRSDLSR